MAIKELNFHFWQSLYDGASGKSKNFINIGTLGNNHKYLEK